MLEHHMIISLRFLQTSALSIWFQSIRTFCVSTLSSWLIIKPAKFVNCFCIQIRSNFYIQLLHKNRLYSSLTTPPISFPTYHSREDIPHFPTWESTLSAPATNVLDIHNALFSLLLLETLKSTPKRKWSFTFSSNTFSVSSFRKNVDLFTY